MDDKEFKARVARLNEVAKVLQALPAEVRLDAFALLKAYVTGSKLPDAKTFKEADSHSDDPGEGSEIFTQHEHDQPADNVKLIAAFYYSQYGDEPFTVEEIRDKARDVGITVPSRIDMTLKSSLDDGKKLFASAGRGKYKPTVHGEAYLKRTYNTRKGRNKRAE